MDEVVAAELKRIRDEDDRQNHRIDQLEQTVEKLNELMLTIQRLAMSVESPRKSDGRATGLKLSKMPRSDAWMERDRR